MIFNWYVNGDDDHTSLSTRAIGIRLCEVSVPPPSTNGQTNYVWLRATIQHILKNETYAGSWYYGKSANCDGRRVTHPEHHWLPASTPAVIAPEIWKLVQRKRGENVIRAPRKIRNSYLLHHHVTRAKCGSRMAARCESRRLYYYGPMGRKRTGRPTRCSNTAFYRADHTDAIVWNYLRDYLANPDLVKSGLEQFIEQNEEATSPIRERMKIIRNLLDQDREHLKKIADIYIDGVFSKVTLLQRKKKLEGRMAALAREFAELMERLQSWSHSPEQTEALSQVDLCLGRGRSDH